MSTTNFDDAITEQINVLVTAITDFDNGRLPAAFKYANAVYNYEIRYEKEIQNGLEVWQAQAVSMTGAVVSAFTGTTLQAAMTQVVFGAAVAAPYTAPFLGVIYAQGTVVNAQAATMAGDGTADAVKEIITSDWWEQNVFPDQNSEVDIKLIANDGVLDEEYTLVLRQENSGVNVDIAGNAQGINIDKIASVIAEDYSKVFYGNQSDTLHVDITGGTANSLGYYNLFSNDAFSNTFSSLGFSNSFMSDFNNAQWSNIGLENDFGNDTYEMFGTSFTLFGENETISMPGVTPSSTNFGSGVFHLNDLVSGWQDTFMDTQNHVSPLAFDLDGDGIETTHLTATEVFFDIDGDGYAEKVGWIGADDGQLAIDTNGDGVINDITELFGDDIMPAYEKLGLYDTNKDGVINQSDTSYDDLMVWKDLNQDGYSDANELFALDDNAILIKEISLAEQPLDYFDNENYISGSSSFKRFDNSEGTMYDVHFLNDNVNTWFTGAQSQQFGSTYEVNAQALLMPLSRGYGSLASLHIAMTDNPELLNKMKGLTALDADSFYELSSRIEEFMYEWAGVIDNDPKARKTGNGSNIDARKVDFLEQFTGVEWQQMGMTDLVGSKASLGVKKVWAQTEAMMTARILVQGPLADDIFQNASYDFVTDTMTLGDTMTDIISRASTYIASAPAYSEQDFWMSMGNILIQHKTELGVTTADISSAIDTAYGSSLHIGEMTITAADGDIFSAISGTSEVLDVNTYVGTDNLVESITGSNFNDYIFGKNGTNYLHGEGGDDFIRGGDDGDLVYAGGGDDRVEGGGSADSLFGGFGRDDLRGGDGNDQLFGQEGDDKLHGGAGADSLDGGTGSDEIDYLESDSGVYVNLETRTALGGHAEGDTFTNVENITGSNFSDVLIGDEQDNSINGEAGDDIIYGGDGNDDLFGAGGEDKLYGEAGDDMFDGFEGAELMDGGTGNDTVNYVHPYGTEGVVADLSKGVGVNGYAEGDIYVDIENLIGSRQSDILIGDSGANRLTGLEGNDLLDGGAGDDTLLGGTGFDQLIGGAGNDTFVITPQNEVIVRVHDFNPGADKLDYSYFTSEITQSANIEMVQVGNDTLLGVDGDSRVLLKGVLPSQLNTSDFIFNNTTLAGLTTVTTNFVGEIQDGDTFGNKLKGTLLVDIVDGKDGNDEISGMEGDDTLRGGAGDDILQGGAGADTLVGGAGFDQATYRDSYEGVQVNLLAGTGVGGTAEGDTLNSIEAVYGSSFDDVLTGGNGSDTLHGDLGDDVLYTKGGQYANLYGGKGGDTFVIEQVSGPAFTTDTGLSVLSWNGAQYVSEGGTPTALTYIHDFEAGNSNEKIDLSSFTADRIVVTSIHDVAVEGEVMSGTSIQVFNGASNQTILLKDTDYSELIESNFIMPSTFAFSSIEWQERNFSVGENDILTGSSNDDTLFGLGGEDVYLLGGEGSDTAYVNNIEVTEPGINSFIVARNSGDVDIIQNYAGFNNYVLWYPGTIYPTSVEFSFENPNIVGQYSYSYMPNAFDLSAFSNIRDFNDLSIVSNANNTEIHLGDNQKLVLNDFVNQSFAPGDLVKSIHGINTNDIDFYGDISPYGISGLTGNGTLFDLVHHTIEADNFVFYSGILSGTSDADILQGGYGVDVINGSDGDDTLTGEGDNDTLNGGAGSDTLDGGVGNDTLNGGDGGDTYIVAKESGATDTVVNFEYWHPNEKIDLTAFDADFANFQAFSSSISQQGNDVHIDLGNNQKIVLQNVLVSAVVAQNFIGNVSINGAVSAADDSFRINEDVTLNGNVLLDNGSGVDSDVDADALSVVAYSGLTEQGGSITVNSDGSFTYVPALNFSGTDSFSYTLTDGNGSLDQARATVVVNELNEFGVQEGTSGDDVLYGTADADSIDGLAGADTLFGSSNDDTLNGGQGDDTIDGGLGSDIIDGGDGIDTVTYANSSTFVSINLSTNGNWSGDASWDTLTNIENIIGSDHNDTLVGDAGDNMLEGGLGSDFIDGGAGIDTLSYANSSTWVSSDLGSNSHWNGDASWDNVLNVENLRGSAHNDYLYGSSIANVLYGGAGNDALYGQDGDDILEGGLGSDYIDGGAGTDTVSYVASASYVSIDLGANNHFGGDASWDNILNVENATGSAHNDYLTGSSGANVLTGGAGNDTLSGADGNDTLLGGSGDDLLEGGLGSDTLDGGDGIDTAIYANSSTFVSIDLAANSHWSGDASWDSISNVENVIGSDYNDTITGDAQANVLTGGIGNDTLNGNAGNDTLIGGVGNDVISAGDGSDTLIGGAGSDYLDGGAGIDIISYAGSSAGVNVDLGANNHWGGDASWDNVLNVENVYGSDHADVISGDTGGNELFGNAGADTLNGLDGNDTIHGDADDDIITGGLGQDTLYGGTGADIFKLTSLSDSQLGTADMIMDFEQGTDQIDVSGLGFTGLESSQTPAAGNLGTYTQDGDTYLTDGVNFELRIQGELTLTNADLIN